MLELVEYHFGNDPRLSSEVANIRGGTNDYPDLAKDLVRLANLYDEESDSVSRDAFYDAQDPLLARTLASQVYEQIRLQTPKDQATINELYSKAWTLLDDSYSETLAGAAFLFRKQPEMLKQFPPIRSLGRTSHRAGTAARGEENKPPE